MKLIAANKRARQRKLDSDGRPRLCEVLLDLFSAAKFLCEIVSKRRSLCPRSGASDPKAAGRRWSGDREYNDRRRRRPQGSWDVIGHCRRRCDCDEHCCCSAGLNREFAFGTSCFRYVIRPSSLPLRAIKCVR